MNDELNRRATFEALARETLAPYGVTDLHFDWLGRSDYDGREMVNIITPSTDDIEVSDMIRLDILEKAPLYLDVSAHGAGKTFRYKGWDGCGGAAFMCIRSHALRRASRAYDDARITAGMLSNPIDQDRVMDIAQVRYDETIRSLPPEVMRECEDENWRCWDHVAEVRNAA